MSGRPLVSVVTPTWGRPDLLAETIAHVRRQSYPNIEHVIVVDGPMDKVTQATVAKSRLHGYPYMGDEQWGRIPVRVHSLGWRPTEELRDSFAVGALTLGALVARGEYQMWLCDDERMADDHVESLVDLLEARGVDFVYPRVYLWRAGNPDGGFRIGVHPPQFGHVTSVLYRRSCLDRGMYRFHIPKWPGAAHAAHDWDLVNRWVENGATCAMLERETLSHREDH